MVNRQGDRPGDRQSKEASVRKALTAKTTLHQTQKDTGSHHSPGTRCDKEPESLSREPPSKDRDREIRGRGRGPQTFPRGE